MTYSIIKMRAPSDGAIMSGLPQEGISFMLEHLKKFDDADGDYWVFPWPDGVGLPWAIESDGTVSPSTDVDASA